ncbi:MAG: DUF1538 domain-containing protein [Sphaerochaeta sp.]|jgi:hypothetical protein|nr:MAG: DUF1538 domain-containing protein [Sphaerochaeta sp.]HPB42589.1 DUF1538 domain-containing protein [Sphaerochaeta sp.]HPY46030.1 DUF1538 domain-containing protein [Sphaerochaeta sp.]HQB05766.1 DUF1538 domain-containing protein [Sphaerochaeta sp.]
MELLNKLKEISSSIIPILLLVTIMHFFIAPLEEGVLLSFYISGVLVIFGLSLILLGVDLGILPIGEKIGSAVTRTRSNFLIGATGFIAGIVIIIAEPNIAMLSEQVSSVNPAINTRIMVAMIAIGVGFYVMVGMLRQVYGIPVIWIYLISYIIVFTLAIFSTAEMMAIGFDSGGSATGPLSVPFIMALGIGVARVQKVQKEADSFGYVSLALIGPALALIILGIVSPGTGTGEGSQATVSQAGGFIALIRPSLQMATQAITPMFILSLLYQVFLLKMPSRQMLRAVVGFVYLYIGLTLFFIGSTGGFIPVGYQIGYLLGQISPYLLLFSGLIIGAITAISESSVWVLVNQVQEITKGHLRRSVMLAAISIGVGLSLFLAVLRIWTGLPFWSFILPAYVIAITLAFFVPELFVGLSFDSGTVASGPMASTFILAFAIGSSMGLETGNAGDAFGIIAFVSVTPVLVVEILGLLYKRTQAKLKKEENQA